MSIYKKFGIYGIRNKINNKIYIGKTMVNFGDRWDCHRSQLRGGYHDNPHLQSSWNKYGEDNFEFIIINDCPQGISVEEVNKLEIEEISKYKRLNLSYNISDGGDGGLFLGKHLPDETKRKIGEKNRINMMGRKPDDKTRRKMADAQRDRYFKLSEGEKQMVVERLRNANKGRKWSDKEKQNFSEIQKVKPNGAKYTLEQVREIRRLHEQDGKSYTEISNILGIPHHTVYLIATYRRWKDAI